MLFRPVYQYSKVLAVYLQNPADLALILFIEEQPLMTVRREGSREVSRKLRHYRLEAILAVGYRVRSHRGTQFRQWATAHLEEYLIKGFVLDDERLKNPPGPGVPDYFDELLERIRDIRASERRMDGRS